MSANHQDTREHLQRIVVALSHEEIERWLEPKHHEVPARVPGATHAAAVVVAKRWELLPHAVVAVADADAHASCRISHNLTPRRRIDLPACR